MKTRTIAIGALILLVFGGIAVAGCIDSPIPATDDREFVGTWTVSGTFFADGELCDAVFTLEADGTGIRELVSPTTGKAVQTETLAWERTGEFDTVKITYEDGYEELTSLGWLKGSW